MAWVEAEAAMAAGEDVPDFVFGSASAHEAGLTYSVMAFQGTRYELLVGATTRRGKR